MKPLHQDRFNAVEALTGSPARVYGVPMSTLRDDIEQIVIEHFDPSVMGRAQAVDAIMESIAKHNLALAVAWKDPAPKTADAVQDGQNRIAAAINIIRTDPPAGRSVVEQIHNAAIPRRARSW